MLHQWEQQIVDTQFFWGIALCVHANGIEIPARNHHLHRQLNIIVGNEAPTTFRQVFQLVLVCNQLAAITALNAALSGFIKDSMWPSCSVNSGSRRSWIFTSDTVRILIAGAPLHQLVGVFWPARMAPFNELFCVLRAKARQITA